MDSTQNDMLQHLLDAAKHYGSSILSRRQYIRYRFHHAKHAPTVQRVTRHFSTWNNAIAAAGLQDGYTAKRLRCLHCGHRYYASPGSSPQCCDTCAAQPIINPVNRTKERIARALRIVSEHYERIPTISDYRKYLNDYPVAPLPSISSIYRQYGTWADALKAIRADKLSHERLNQDDL